MAKVRIQKIQMEEFVIKRVANCPMHQNIAEGYRPVIDGETCRRCRLHDPINGCVGAAASISTTTDAIWDEESEEAIYIWRFKCHHCGHPVIITSHFQNMSNGDVGRCSLCGAWHYNVCYDTEKGNQVKHIFLISKPERDTASSVLEIARNDTYQARVPNEHHTRPRTRKKGGK